MDCKILLLLLFAIICNAQHGNRIVVGPGGGVRLPIVTRQNSIISDGYRTIPSGNVRQFVSYPSLRNEAIGAAELPSGLVLERLAQLGLANGLTGGIPLGVKSQVLGPVLAAIITQRTAEIIDVPVPQDVITPQVLIVEPNLLPVTIEFRSQSSPVNINQVHIPGPPGEFKETRSEEEPDRVLHEVIKPVIQEVREIIQPFRRITQQILPVQEEIHSVVARGENQKVIQEVAIPPPQPIAVSAIAAPVAAPIRIAAQQIAVAQPIAVAQRLAIAQPLAVAQPLALAQPLAIAQPLLAGPALTGTVVRAGLIGGARIVQAPGLGVQPIDGGLRIPYKREALEEEVAVATSVNNRPNGPVKRETAEE